MENKEFFSMFGEKSDEGIFLDYFSQIKSYKSFTNKKNYVEENTYFIFDETNHLAEEGFQVNTKVFELMPNSTNN